MPRFQDHRVRYLLAVAASNLAIAGSLILGFALDRYVTKLRIPLAGAATFICSMAVAIALAFYIVKKLLVDYW